MPLDAAQAKAMQDAGQTLELDEKTQKPVLRIAEGTVLELDPQSAQEQIASGNVEKVVEEGKPNDQVYMRELCDYARVYRDMNLQIEELVRTTAEVNRQSAAVTDSQQKVTSDIAYRKSEQTALTHDLAHYAAEQKLITGHAQALDSLIANIAAKVSQIKASNQQLESQLAALAQQAVQFMNQRAAAPKTQRNLTRLSIVGTGNTVEIRRCQETRLRAPIGTSPASRANRMPTVSDPIDRRGKNLSDRQTATARRDRTSCHRSASERTSRGEAHTKEPSGSKNSRSKLLQSRAGLFEAYRERRGQSFGRH